MRLRTIVPITLLTVVVVAACGGGDDGGDTAGTGEPVATTEVAVVDNDFEPEEIVVEVGSTVRWTWEGSNPHDVKGDGFVSEIETSGTFQHTFDAPGEFPYVCTVHPGMRGRVVVE